MSELPESGIRKRSVIKSLLSRLFKSDEAQMDGGKPDDKGALIQGVADGLDTGDPSKGVSSTDIKTLVARLKKENVRLTAQLAKLRAKVVREDLLSGKELQLEEENEFLKRRIREITEKAKVLKANYNRLPAALETIETLRTRNSFLTIKLDRQKEILASLAGKDPKSQELSARLKKLATENKELKDQIMGQSHLMEKVSEKFSTTEMASTFNNLMETNRSIEQSIAVPVDVDKITEKGNPKGVLAAFEQMEDENFKLREVLKSRKRVSALVDGSEPETMDTDMEVALHGLQEENRRLEMAFAVKEEKLKILDNPVPFSPKLFERIRSQKREKEILLAQLSRSERRIEELDAQIRTMYGKLSAKEDLSVETQQLKVRLEQAEHFLVTLKETETKYKKLRMEYSTLETQYQSTLSQLKEMTAKAAKLTAAYDVLTQEYEKLFESI